MTVAALADEAAACLGFPVSQYSAGGTALNRGFGE